MELRLTPDGDPIELSIDDFKELVRGGSVHPNAQFRDKGTAKWISVTTNSSFLRNIPVNYKYQNKLECLCAKAAEERRKDEEMKARLWGLYDEYPGCSVEKLYGISPLNKVYLETGAVGAARLIVFPSFAAERVFTFIFRSNCVCIESVYGPHPTNLYRKFEPGSLEPQPCSYKVTRLRAELGYSSLPEPFQSWEAFRHRAVDLQSCECLCFDGASFLQKVLVDDEIQYAHWSNPDEGFPDQAAMVDAYAECIEKAGLYEIGEVIRGFACDQSLSEFCTSQLTMVRNLVDDDRIDEARAEASRLLKFIPDFTLTEHFELIFQRLGNDKRLVNWMQNLRKAGLPM
jgi:hypothetical protein